MLVIRNAEVFNLDGAIRGMRFPLQSKNDSYYDINNNFVLGEKDLILAKKLIGAGHDSHSKFMRQILVSMDITAPLYW